MAANVPPLPLAPSLPTAIALLERFEAVELRGVERGPHETYYAGYLRLNAALDTAAARLVEALRARGRMSVTLGESFTISGRSVTPRAAATTSVAS